MTPGEVVPVLLAAGIVAGVAAGGRPWRPRSLRPSVPARPVEAPVAELPASVEAPAADLAASAAASSGGAR